MKKFELNVVRYNNEDVIATSGVVAIPCGVEQDIVQITGTATHEGKGKGNTYDYYTGFYYDYHHYTESYDKAVVLPEADRLTLRVEDEVMEPGYYHYIPGFGFVGECENPKSHNLEK